MYEEKWEGTLEDAGSNSRTAREVREPVDGSKLVVPVSKVKTLKVVVSVEVLVRDMVGGLLWVGRPGGG